jgi:mannose-1-phosphate guanylyltransferase
VPTDAEGRVEAFLEKTDAEPPTNQINAGAYVIEREVVDGIAAGRAVSFEREVFPALVGDGLYGFPAPGYWIDIGTPERYLEATWDLLAGRVRSKLPRRDETGSLVYEGCLLSGAHVGPQAVLGRHCSVGSDSRIERSVLHDRVVVGADAAVVESVLATRVRVGANARVLPGAVVGAGAVIGEGATIGEGARIDPGTEIPSGEEVGAGRVMS